MMGFDFPLLSDDPQRSAAIAMEALRGEDERGAGWPRRITYLIDPEGVIRRAYRVVREEVVDHPGRVLEDFRSLQSQG
jgi:peroxiredoxin